MLYMHNKKPPKVKVNKLLINIEKNMKNPIAVFGTGSWGTALAILLARNGQTCRLWGFDKKEVEEMKNTGESRYLPGIKLPSNLFVSDSLEEVINDANDWLFVVPSFAFAQTLQSTKPFQTDKTRIAWGTKGLDPQGRLLHHVAREILGEKTPLAVISGPSFAKEVAAGLPTAVTLATKDDKFGEELSERLHASNFRVYLSHDINGVELGGVIKNVLAIATGIADGLEFGANARCALITRGMAEMMRLNTAVGGEAKTLMGLSGLGDLILTCTDNQSRNRRFGLAIGKGANREQAEKEVGQVIEGAQNVKQLHHLAKQLNVDMPITEQVYRILFENTPPRETVIALLMRGAKWE